MQKLLYQYISERKKKKQEQLPKLGLQKARENMSSSTEQIIINVYNSTTNQVRQIKEKNIKFAQNQLRCWSISDLSQNKKN